jgi:hypothetical protein
MICWVAIRLDQDRIIIYAINEVHFVVVGLILTRLAVNQIVKHGVSLDLQPNDMCLALMGPIVRLIRGNICAFTIVAWRQTCRASVAGMGIESFGGTETSVGMAIRDQIVGVRSVQGGSLRLCEINISSGSVIVR